MLVLGGDGRDLAIVRYITQSAIAERGYLHRPAQSDAGGPPG